MKKFNNFPKSIEEAQQIAEQYINDPEGLSYDFGEPVEALKPRVEIKHVGNRLIVCCDGMDVLPLYLPMSELGK